MTRTPKTARPARPAMTARTVLSLAVALTLCLALAPVVSTESADPATPAASSTSSADPRLDQVRTESLDRVAGVRRQVSTGRLADAVAAAASLVDVPVRPASPAPALAPAGVPAATAAPVSQLLGAITYARAEVAAAIPEPEGLPDPGELTDAILDHATSLSSAGDAADPGEVRMQQLAQRATTEVDRQRLYAAALTLAGTIDSTLPALRAHADGQVVAGAEVEGCDEADHPPLLCIGGEGDNTYPAGVDYALQIDLGGDDTYRNAAGGADTGVLTNGEGNGHTVAVAIDLGGDDTYDATPAGSDAEASGATVVQGAGYAGIGMLVDTVGDDTYRASAAADANHRAIGQGTGIAGVGLLADLAGDDTYTLSAVDGAQAAYGQGSGLLAGLGLLVDRQGGNDSYRIHADTDPRQNADGEAYLAPQFVGGLGLAQQGGAAVFSDGGGADTMSADATSRPIAADDPRPQRVVNVVGVTYAGGFAALGAGAVALAGDGPTTWRLSSQATAPRSGTRQALGLGFARTGSFAAVDDAGGNDSYTATATSTAHRQVAADDGCDCPGAHAHAEARRAWAAGMGAGSTAGAVALLHDAAGDDTYLLEAAQSAWADATDQRSATTEVGDLGAWAEAEGGSPKVEGQGAGLLNGAGLLQDDAGDDSYALNTRVEADAQAAATNSDALVDGQALAGPAESFGQAYASGGLYAGLGELRDLGGADRYASTNTVHVMVDPPTEATSQDAASHVQASGGRAAYLVDLDDGDGGAADVFTAIPAAPAPCVGERGGGLWFGAPDCSDSTGLHAVAGVNDDTAQAAAPQDNNT